jgi:hypothetical protein
VQIAREVVTVTLTGLKVVVKVIKTEVRTFKGVLRG